MRETVTDIPFAVVLSRGDESVAQAVVAGLTQAGWELEVLHGPTDAALARVADGDRPVDGVVFVPGLLTDDRDADAAGDLLALVDSLSRRFRPATAGGARVVAVTSRDWLGWPSRPRIAAQAAGLVAAARSLALLHGRSGVTVNTVVALPPEASPLRADGPVPGTHLHEPASLLPEPVTEDDIAATVSFFLDHRSGYITGQTLHCCGGASLLSSLSV
jgi:NAD(P)-dependent dehydrogenase (short-subunit alcohol dehydrogenase family)